MHDLLGGLPGRRAGQLRRAVPADRRRLGSRQLGLAVRQGRFGFAAGRAQPGPPCPCIRRGDALVEAGWAEALDVAAAGLAAAKGVGGGSSLAVIGGARLHNEDAYAWAKAARVALGTDNVDAQLADGLPADTVLGLPRATIHQAAQAPLVITLGGDIKDEAPILYLRLRDAGARAARSSSS